MSWAMFRRKPKVVHPFGFMRAKVEETPHHGWKYAIQAWDGEDFEPFTMTFHWTNYIVNQQILMYLGTCGFASRQETLKAACRAMEAIRNIGMPTPRDKVCYVIEEDQCQQLIG